MASLHPSATIARIYGRWPSLLPSCFKTGGKKMNDWTPVLIVALVVVCVTAFLLLDPKSRTPRKDR
jgi:hypothetical protein